MLLSLQTNLIFITIILYGNAVKPPGYVQPSKAPDPNPPKYEYEYKISDERGSGQGKQEQRDGIYALGRYYVQGENSKQDVQYFADDWGYHPVVEYSSLGPYSKSTTQFALGTEAVQQLKNKESNLPQLQGIFNGNERLDTLNTASSDQKKNDQGIRQYQVQSFTTQPQLQEMSQGNNEENTNQQGSTEETAHTNQQELEQPILLTGEFQQQPLQLQITDLQNTNQQQIPLPEKQPQSRVENQTQNQGKTHNFIFGQQNIPQNSEPAEHQQQFPEHPQTREETVLNQFTESEKNQIHQVILKHEEPTQQIIFPLQPQQNVILNQNANVYDISEKSDQLSYVQLPQQDDFKQPTQHIQLVSDSIIKNQGSINFNLNSDHTERQSFVSLKNSDQIAIKAEQLINEKQNNTYSVPDNPSEAESKVSDTPLSGNTNKLIEHTQNLVTGKDVLNINNAITQEYRVNTESSTPISSIAEHDVSQIVSKNTITNILINHEDISHSTSSTPLTPSLNEQPIIVADLEESTSIKTTDSTQEKYQSFISTTPGALSHNFDTSAPATVIVTPRPVSAGILAPITAGIQLQNIEVQTEDIKNFDKQQYKVEIQQSLPYYLGKIEYPVSAYDEQLLFNSSLNETSSAELKAGEDIELGKTLLFFPGQDLPKAEVQGQPQFVYKQPLSEVNNDITVQQLPLTQIKDNFIELDQQQAQGYQHQLTVQHAAVNYVTPVPTEITKIIHKPYPVKIPYQVPYQVVKQVPVPVTVQKIVDRPIHLTKYVEKPVAVPQPYPVQKIVEKPVHIPIQITKYIERPYPVEVRVPYPQPYPVEKIVQKIVKQPYPVEVRIPVPVEKIIEKKVPVTQYVEKPVEKIVEKPVPHYIDRPYPVEVQVPYPQPYLVQVEVPKYPLQLIQKPYGAAPITHTSNQQSYNIPTIVNIPHNLPLKLPLPIYDQTGSFNKKTEQQAQQSQQQQTYIYANPYAYAPQINQYLSPKQELTLNNGYLPAPQIDNYFPHKKDCQQNLDAGLRNLYYTIKPDDYIGLLPPKASTSQVNLIGKLRTARSNFDEKNIRMEYGFMPPLIPSLEIDEQGNPIDKSEK